MKYKDFVRTSDNFQASVNLQFDLNKIDKINSYIPTQQSVEVLGEFLKAIYSDKFNEDNATVLIGPYGRGKSHLLLILSAIMRGIYDKANEESVNKLIKRINVIDETVGRAAWNIIARKRPMLTVVINSNYNDINQSFLIGLREALERENLLELFPDTYFDAAVTMIDTWKSSYKEAWDNFKQLLKNKKTTATKIKNGLNKCDRDAYKIFCEIYPQITNGAEFNPLINSDIIKVYSDVSKNLSERYNYSGIFIVFDEFSKFLESSSAIADMKNMKLIQDFAELATRSADSQIHICCITHKDILEYSQTDSFRTVDGRFKKVYFVAPSEQSYELIANALEHKKEYYDFFKKHRNFFDEITQINERTNIFNNISSTRFFDLIIRNCFPIHPISIYVLTRISEKVGQNERTLFTFLSHNGENTLNEFLEEQEVTDIPVYLTIDKVYDYFSELFKAEVFNKTIHSIWAKTTAALKQAKTVDERKIIKTLGAMYIVADDLFPATYRNLKTSLAMADEDEFDIALNALKENHLITQKRNGHYAFLTPNGVDISRDIKNSIAQGLVKLNRRETIFEVAPDYYILPRQYNSNKNMIRYFLVSFIDAEDYLAYTGDYSDFIKNADGVIMYIITLSDTEKSSVISKIITQDIPDNVVLSVSENWKDDEDLLKYKATIYLKNTIKKDDQHYMEELDLYSEDLFKKIRKEIDKIYSPTNESSVYYWKKNILESVTKPLYLNREISRISDEIYHKTPVVNNEMINKNKITSQIKKARSIVIDHVLKNTGDIPIIEGYGPEVSVLRSLIIIKGLASASRSNDNNLNDVLDAITSYIDSTEGKRQTVAEIYNVLMNAPIGLRKGVIPVYIAYILRSRANNIVIYYKDREVALNGELFNFIEENPEEYYLRLEKGTAEKELYISELSKIFDSYKSPEITGRYNIIIDAMRNWFRGLPKFSREHLKLYTQGKILGVPKNVIKYRKRLLLYDINAFEFLFETSPENFECINDYEGLIRKIGEFVVQENGFINTVYDYLIMELKQKFKFTIDGSLFSILNDWYDSLPAMAKENVYDTDTNVFLKFVKENSNRDDIKTIQKLAKTLTMLSIEDWNDETVTFFLTKVDEVKSAVENYSEQPENEKRKSVTISVDFDGEVMNKNIEDTELSGLGETVLNNLESTMSEYGEAISAQERISLLLKLLKKEFSKM